jgi:hypothetical protein
VKRFTIIMPSALHRVLNRSTLRPGLQISPVCNRDQSMSQTAPSADATLTSARVKHGPLVRQDQQGGIVAGQGTGYNWAPVACVAAVRSSPEFRLVKTGVSFPFSSTIGRLGR